MHILSIMIMQTEFVEHIPENLEKGVLYVSMTHTVAIHLCACGCGEEVITPLHPRTGWIITYDGVGVSLNPSIGNWNFQCESHYFITNSRVRWCPVWMNRDWWERKKSEGSFALESSEQKKEQPRKWKWPKLKKKIGKKNKS